MFDFFTSAESRARGSAARWLEIAATVWNVRKDRLSAEEAAELSRSREELSRLVADRADAGRLKLAIDGLESVLRRTGGVIYPRTAWAENVEFFLVAAIVILGIRTYFFQPMVIPTNSMWPTYFGLTADNFPPGTPAPGPLARIARLAVFGAVREEIDAPAAGEVSAIFFVDADGEPLLDADGNPQLIPRMVEGRSWLVFPAKLAEYTLYVNGRPVTIRLPEDFHDFDAVIAGTYFPPGRSFAAQWSRSKAAGRIDRALMVSNGRQTYYAYRMPLGTSVAAGEPLVRFDLMKGDLLVVDRLSYHFVRPRVGSAFVFETGNIPKFLSAGYPDEYLIKRLVGGPGDVLKIVPPVLFRNGKPIEGAAAFAANGRRLAPYRGYFNGPAGRAPYLLPGESATVPAHSFMGLGDNSPISEDGRYWGFVPEKDVIGRPIFIYYPFTRRWGWAK